MVSIYILSNTNAGGLGPAERRHFGTPELRLEGFSPGTPVSLLRLFVWFRKNSVHVWGQTYVLDLIQIFLRCAQANIFSCILDILEYALLTQNYKPFSACEVFGFFLKKKTYEEK